MLLVDIPPTKGTPVLAMVAAKEGVMRQNKNEAGTEEQ
jgi:hypothetical protein